MQVTQRWSTAGKTEGTAGAGRTGKLTQQEAGIKGRASLGKQEGRRLEVLAEKLTMRCLAAQKQTRGHQMCPCITCITNRPMLENNINLGTMARVFPQLL